MQSRWGRIAQLSGVLFAVLIVVSIFAGGGETPNGDASPARVIAYYTTHKSEAEASGIVFAFAFLFLVLWAGMLRSYLRRTPEAEGSSALVLAGAVLMAVGGVTLSGLEFGLAHQIHHLEPDAAQTVSFLSNEMFLPLIVGGCVLGLGAGISILRGAALPRWLGWAAIVLGVVVLIPPLSFPALLVFAIWVIVVSVLMYRRYEGAPAAAAAAAAPA
jgi:hypothetical protein